jgi:hypothetical protein
MDFTFSWMGYFLAIFGLMALSLVLTTLCGGEIDPSAEASAGNQRGRPGFYRSISDSDGESG